MQNEIIQETLKSAFLLMNGKIWNLRNKLFSKSAAKFCNAQQEAVKKNYKSNEKY